MQFKANALTILGEGPIAGEVIDQRKLIDQHYYAIASKATILKPKELAVPADKFKGKFSLEWEDALAQGVVFNAMDACDYRKQPDPMPARPGSVLPPWGDGLGSCSLQLVSTCRHSTRSGRRPPRMAI